MRFAISVDVKRTVLLSRGTSRWTEEEKVLYGGLITWTSWDIPVFSCSVPLAAHKPYAFIKTEMSGSTFYLQDHSLYLVGQKILSDIMGPDV